MIKKPLSLYAVLVCIAGFIIMWVFRSHQQFADGLSNALSAKQGKELFNPHDMILPSVVHVMYKLAQVFYKGVSVLDVAAFHNTLCAAITLVCIFLVSFKLTQRFISGVAPALALMVTGGFWLFVPLVEVYVPAQAWLAVASVLLIYRGFSVFNTSKWVWISVCIIASTLYHQTGVLFILPLLVFTARANYAHKWLTYLKIVALSAGVLLTVYIMVYIVSFHTFSVTGFYKYCFSYYYTLRGANPDWGTFHNFSKAGFQKFVESITVGIFTVNPGSLLTNAWIYGWLWTALVVGSFVYALFTQSANRGIVILFSSWLLFYSVFILWWTPGFEFISLLLYPLWGLLTYIVCKVADSLSNWLIPYVTMAALVVCLFMLLLINNVPVFNEYMTGENIGLRESKRYNALVGSKGLIITNYNTQTYLRFYFDNFNNYENVQYLAAFYNHDTIPEKFRPNAHKQIAIAFWHFGPWYNWNGKDGWQKPCEWKAFAQSLMDIHMWQDSIMSYSARKCTLHKGTQAGDDAFLVFDTTRYYFHDPATPFKDIDSLLIKNGKGKDAVLKQWFDKNDTLKCK